MTGVMTIIIEYAESAVTPATNRIVQATTLIAPSEPTMKPYAGNLPKPDESPLVK